MKNSTNCIEAKVIKKVTFFTEATPCCKAAADAAAANKNVRNDTSGFQHIVGLLNINTY